MQITEKTKKPLIEAKYLNADNVSRYRTIMRIFLINYDKLKYKMYQEDVYAEMLETGMFNDYKIEQCRQDLDMLHEWKNLEAYQDTRYVSTLEEFKNKKFEYSMTDVAVEVERLVERIENLHIEGASLEPTLLERIREQVARFPEMASNELEDARVYAWWDDLNNDFSRLNRNYKDYMSSLSSAKAEQLMQTKAFLMFKDQLVEYLRNFIKNLQRNVGAIEEELRAINARDKEIVLKKILSHEMSIPHIGEEINKEEIDRKNRGRYDSIYEWFCGSNSNESEAAKLFDNTNDIIRKITRYAMQISEKNALGANRRDEYRHIAEIFLKCDNIKDAHKFSAMVFGLESTNHFKIGKERETDSVNTGVYEEAPQEFILKPRVRTYREKTSRSAIRDMSQEKAKATRELIKIQAENMQKIRALEVNGRIDFSNLPVIEPEVREILLSQLSDALEDSGQTARMEDGRAFYLDTSRTNETCILKSTDGNLKMPCYAFVFSEDAE